MWSPFSLSKALNTLAMWRRREHSYHFNEAKNTHQMFIQEVRKFEESGDPTNYYNEWIMSNLG